VPVHVVRGCHNAADNRLGIRGTGGCLLRDKPVSYLPGSVPHCVASVFKIPEQEAGTRAGKTGQVTSRGRAEDYERVREDLARRRKADSRKCGGNTPRNYKIILVNLKDIRNRRCSY